MIRRGDKHHERGAEKCVSEHWVTPLLNLSPSKVSPQGWGGRMGGGGGGKVSEGKGKVTGFRRVRVQVKGFEKESRTNVGKGKFGSGLLKSHKSAEEKCCDYLFSNYFEIITFSWYKNKF